MSKRKQIEELNNTSLNVSSIEEVYPIALGYIIYKGQWVSSKGFGGELILMSKRFSKKATKDYTGTLIVIYNGILSTKEIRVVVDSKISKELHEPTSSKEKMVEKGPLDPSHNIEYSIAERGDDGSLHGSYRSISPGDRGSFSLFPTRETFINKRQSHTKCTIC